MAPDGSVYVSDTLNNRIQKLNASGAFESSFGGSGDAATGLDHPTGLAVDTQGRVLVADSFHRQVQVFSPQGTLIASWTRSSAADGRFLLPAELALSTAGELYVLDSDLGRVEVLDANGTPLRGWNLPAPSSEAFEPTGMAIDAAGVVYVVDEHAARVLRYDSKGALLGTWSTVVAEHGDSSVPSGIEVGPDGLVYVSDTLNECVHKFSPEGVHLADVGSYAIAPTDVAVLSAGEILVADELGGSLVVFGRFGSEAAVSAAAPPAPGSSSAPLERRWMRSLADSKNITELSIPGTHDSGTDGQAKLDPHNPSIFSVLIRLVVKFAGQCQDKSIYGQLNAGVRFLDIRLKVNERTDSMEVWHGDFKMERDFDGVLSECRRFLKENPGESVLMLVVREGNGDLTKFRDVFERKYFDHPDYRNLWWPGTKFPTLGQARDKIVLFKRFDFDRAGIHLNNGWSDNATFERRTYANEPFKVQDRYSSRFVVAGQEAKDAAIGDLLDEAHNTRNDPEKGKQLFINFASWDAQPIQAQTRNGYVEGRVNGFSGPTRLGVVLMDYPPDDLLRKLINKNF